MAFSARQEKEDAKDSRVNNFVSQFPNKIFVNVNATFNALSTRKQKSLRSLVVFASMRYFPCIAERCVFMTGANNLCYKLDQYWHNYKGDKIFYSLSLTHTQHEIVPPHHIQFKLFFSPFEVTFSVYFLNVSSSKLEKSMNYRLEVFLSTCYTI